jgi:hypothetical protein
VNRPFESLQFRDSVGQARDGVCKPLRARFRPRLQRVNFLRAESYQQVNSCLAGICMMAKERKRKNGTARPLLAPGLAVLGCVS